MDDLHDMPRGKHLHDFIDAGFAKHQIEKTHELEALIFDIASEWGTRIRLVALEPYNNEG